MNEVGSGLMIADSLDGVPVDVSASLIMETVRTSLSLIFYLFPLIFSAAIRFWREQLLPRCTRLICIYRWVRCDVNWDCMVEGSGEEINSSTA